MSSKILKGLRRSVGVTLLAGGFIVAAAGIACADAHSVGQADGQATSLAAAEPIKAPDRGPVGPLTISGAAAGNDAALTVATDGTTVVVSGRAHVESPVDHDLDTGLPFGGGRGAGFDTEPVGFVGGVTGDSSSADIVGVGRIGVEKHYYVQGAP
ncbi:hypothetical protein [Nocardioides sp.]|uniref:hypothetical protein n=1 Tax=Nocardioides sp. TaxID=35761 RepID=UPI001992CBFF|nr:hypothetical protein [Nocardioides sp.]MBC7278471.1 hypothetical protein [Nocardioides sp.]